MTDPEARCWQDRRRQINGVRYRLGAVSRATARWRETTPRPPWDSCPWRNRAPSRSVAANYCSPPNIWKWYLAEMPAG